ncbi:serine/threonine-protein kinase [Actinosynnema sp. NPDC047251]|uniref:non-specific serine/threonine protein kinase n=1 Tax=Saccharothrix espanaensis (strain ATCC 51144 / DSM 44229 / JCM 9112 / NBRC 15066 / NRRL 15764) TaxID=1179773 RepID=K0KBT3_SACES|nr:serine/threonine-protein kinase [Saccharothrix espanaensis]CCH35007.1 Serine/threonine protein kinase [Saccharothrix espanaensis DSM 44229]
MQLPGLADLTPLGQGGFATVYRARQVQLGRDVAVKVDNRVLQTERDRRRFLREAQAAARLSGHPHVVSVHDANFTPQGTPYLVMELCTGGSLADLIRRDGPLPAERVRQIGVQLADALAAAHAEGVLHRDIKPGNILLDRYGTAKLADFGLAALLDAEGSSTVTRDALSPSYASPEAFAMAKPTPAADVYSLAATLYDLLAGKPPRPVPWPIESFDHLGEVLRSPVPLVAGVPQDLHDTIVRALVPDISYRTGSAAQLRDELKGVAHGYAPSTPPQHAPPPQVLAPQHGSQQPVSGPLPAVRSGPPHGGGYQQSGPPQHQQSGPAQHQQQYQQHSGPPVQYANSGPLTPRRKPWALVAVVAVSAVVVAGGTWWVIKENTGQNAAQNNAGKSNAASAGEALETVPPRLKVCGSGYCMAEPTCYHGITSIGGQAASARRAGDCSTPHRWEAFSGGWLSGAIPQVDNDELVKAPEVKNVCTAEAMKANTRPAVDTSTWEISAVAFSDGDRSYFHCFAKEPGAGEVTTSAFGS